MLQHVYEGKVIIMKGGADYPDLAEEKYPGILAELEQFATPIIYYWIKTQKITPYKVGDTTYYDSVWAIEGPVSNAIQSNPDNVSTFAQKRASWSAYYAENSFCPPWLGELFCRSHS